MTDKQKYALPLFQAHPKLADALPWRSIGAWPTPVQPAPRFADAHGLSELYIKRDDLSHPNVGGNKPRGLEFLLAEAQRRGAGSIVTLSSVGSHHIARTAWHARQVGIDTIAVVVDQPNATYVRENLALAHSAGARYIHATYLSALPRFLFEQWRPANRRSGRPPYFVLPGGTNRLSCAGHVNAAFELREQIRCGLLPEPDYLFVAMGSLGTVAGLMLGCKLAGLRTRVVGIVVSHRWYCTPGRTARIARRTLRLLRQCDPSVPTVSVRGCDFDIINTALGEGYAFITADGVAVSRQLYDLEGIVTDGTYTAKTIAGMLAYIRERALQESVHLYWNTYHPLPRDITVSASHNDYPLHLRRYFQEPVQPLDAQLPRLGSPNEDRG